MASVVPTDVPSRAKELIATAISCSIFSTLFVAARILTRLRINHIGPDDYVALLSLPFCIVFSTLVAYDTRYGMGLHALDFPGNLREDYQKWIYIGAPSYLISLLTYKLAIVLLYLRIFNVNNVFRYCTWAVTFIITGYLFSNFWTQIFGCNPIAKA